MVHRVIIRNEEHRDLNPVGFGYHTCPPSHSYGPKARINWRIYYVFSGKGIFKINGECYHVSAGSMFFIPPYVPAYYEADAVKPWDYVWVDFTSQGALPVELPEVMECPAAQPIFHTMKRCEQQEGGRTAFLCAKLWELFALLLENSQILEDSVAMSLDYMHSEYMNGITVEQITQRLNIDRSYFSTLFKKKTGISPGKYLLDYRMRIAASLLMANGTSVSVTANSVGYSNIYIFSKMFKRYYGVSPREYVRQNKL